MLIYRFSYISLEPLLYTLNSCGHPVLLHDPLRRHFFGRELGVDWHLTHVFAVVYCLYMLWYFYHWAGLRLLPLHCIASLSVNRLIASELALKSAIGYEKALELVLIDI